MSDRTKASSTGAGGQNGAGPGPFTLKEFLGQRHFNTAAAEQRDAGDRAAQARTAMHARQAYKLFLKPAAVQKRVARLPEDVRELVETAIVRFGGCLPRSLYVKTRGDEGAFARANLGSLLEEALLGRVGRVDLRRYGIDIDEDALCVFHEVSLVWLRAAAHAQSTAEADPARVEWRVAGVDLVTNVMRFLGYVDGNSVRFTAQGEIFKATKKRMMTQLVAGEGEDPENAFRFIYRFARSRRLIERTGERTLRLSDLGHVFEERELEDKLKDLLAFAIEDAECGGEPFHQVRLRRILLRLLRRIEAEQSYGAMYVPFLARNSYLTQLAGQGVEEFFADRRERGSFGVLEDLQKLAWNLFHWMRCRLHLLGLVDFGYIGSPGNGSGGPVALRLSRLGASLLAGSPAQDAAGARSTLVVNPDFEILLFPDADAYQLVHTLDRFSKRVASDRLYRFELSEESVRAALADGMGLSEILQVLTDRCRTPLPQNVLFSLRDWGDRAGALTLASARRRLSASQPQALERLLENQRIRDLTQRDAAGAVIVRPGVRIEDFRAIVRDLGFFLEVQAAHEQPRNETGS